MSVKKVPSGWQSFAYDPALKRKRYAGSAKLKRDAVELSHEKAKQWRAAHEGHAPPALPSQGTIAVYAGDWLDIHHGQGTRRPAPATRAGNELKLRWFLRDYGDRPIDGGLTRRDALAWAKKHPDRARVVSAMFNDAIDDELASANPFANRRAKHTDERRFISPLTDAEVDLLARIALETWGPDGYGPVARAWVLFGAWVGTRPGETFSVRWENIDFRHGLVTVQRVKGRKQTDVLPLASVVLDAIRELPMLTNDYYGPAGRRAKAKRALEAVT